MPKSCALSRLLPSWQPLLTSADVFQGLQSKWGEKTKTIERVRMCLQSHSSDNGSGQHGNVSRNLFEGEIRLRNCSDGGA